LELDDEHCEAFWKGQRPGLPPDSYRVLRLIASNPQRVFTPSEIVDEAGIWSDVQYTEVQRHFQLMKKAFFAAALGDLPVDFPIRVIPRTGYTWNEAPPPRPKSILARLFKMKRS
jgi:DNA-binding response OmpR family regulator